MRPDREPTGLPDRQVETSSTSSNGTGALSVAGTKVVTRSVATLKRLIASGGRSRVLPTLAALQRTYYRYMLDVP
ncbi:hypothetical protein GCM10010510_55740 [Streptomyces anandii JCM 4720]|nr:hypothetical protein GCM10010510_55740 [Streptomyces anandii JCM 4720]